MTQSSKDTVVKDGIVLESLPNTTFKVQLEKDQQVVLAVASGKLRRYYIKISPGDRVQIEFSPYDMNRGRIVQRYRPS